MPATRHDTNSGMLTPERVEPHVEKVAEDQRHVQPQPGPQHAVRIDRLMVVVVRLADVEIIIVAGLDVVPFDQIRRRSARR